MNAYRLGESFRALGKDEDARQSYQRAIQEFPSGKYAARARQRLESQFAGN
jgi:TolA-binding protein